ncbi:auxin response factor 10 [Cicer arietinum]|uniref:Auxin response factor n=1 Tax=Cicer arietinum TaxID=3827 RepID=A0A1S2XC78_CICAR|nr:auxin response factor 10 [Cicer arietinum]XP_012570270.1 auxin response factor 10 [Cicer arietinum]XP_012570274.1 auxin response factor 10 [Cicer arietinum]XP_027187385.1 auxin response factor 10 [Cicer arietinum]
MKEAEKSLDPQLWHACAGGMVQMPSVNSKVFYFPQGHAEHAQTNVDFGASFRIPPLILCRVASVKFLADPETDEVFSKMTLIPLRSSELENEDFDGVDGNASENSEKPASFAKTLTQSDANNGGGFSVPRYCAETIFPRLDYSAEPPVQTVIAKDVHGEVWKFRHIYRGTPRRHLLTTGWSSFVNQKKLVAGDSIVFLRGENGELCVGIRRAKRGIVGGLETPSGWSSVNGSCGFGVGGYGAFLREDNKLLRNGCGNLSPNGGGVGGNLGGGRVKVSGESVREAMRLGGSNQPFEVVYYPRASTPEFCVKTSAVKAAMRIQWCSGMRFKMPFETEDSSRISWFMGTISSVHVVDPIRWPNSPWRLLQVTWDEPDLLHNVKRVSPWLVELVSNMSVIHLTPFSPPPRKKFRFPPHPDFPLDVQFPIPTFSGNPFGTNNPLCCLSDNNNNAPASIQGARHAQIGISLSDFHLNNNKLELGVFNPNHNEMMMISNGSNIVKNNNHDKKNKESLSCLLTIGNNSHKSLEKSDNNNNSSSSNVNVKRHQFLLFGQPILTEQQISRKCCSNENKEKEKWFLSDTKSSEQFSSPGKSSTVTSGDEVCWKQQVGILDSGHCKVFLESEDVGRTIDLSRVGSYEELYTKLANMFGIERLSHVLYRDATGAVKQTGEEPFSDFMKTAKRLTILMDSGSKDTRRVCITGTRNAERGLDASNKRGPLSIFA